MHGKYKGDIVANQHRYRFRGDTPLGGYDWDWLFTPAGKQIKLYKKRNEDLIRVHNTLIKNNYFLLKMQ